MDWINIEYCVEIDAESITFVFRIDFDQHLLGLLN